MLPRRIKAAFYTVCSPLMRLNALRYRVLRKVRSSATRVHLGPGQGNYIDGWINVDANCFTAKIDVWADLNATLPFRDGTVDAFYSHHVIEHLASLKDHFAEMYRCLKPGGAIRVGGPNGHMAAIKYLEGDVSWFSDFPDKRRSVGGRLDNFIYCRREHLAILTPSYLSELAAEAGFSAPAVVAPAMETGFPELFSDILPYESESTPEYPHTLLIEAYKPQQ